MRWLLAAAAAAGGLGVAAPTLAQDGNFRSRTVVVFGNDPCPTSTNPDEIIVCARRPEEERFRIPRDLREIERAETIAREDRVGENRAALVSGRTAATGTGSCSTVGPNAMLGCTQGINVVGAARTAIEGLRTATEPTDD